MPAPVPAGGHGLDRSALGDRRAILLGAARTVQGSAAGRRGRPALKCYARKAKRSSRVPATLRRASKRWTSSSRSAQVARARGASVPSRPRVRSATCRASTQVAAHSGDADETLGSICRWPAGGSLPFAGLGTPTVAVIDAGSRARWGGTGLIGRLSGTGVPSCLARRAWSRGRQRVGEFDSRLHELCL